MEELAKRQLRSHDRHGAEGSRHPCAKSTRVPDEKIDVVAHRHSRLDLHGVRATTKRSLGWAGHRVLPTFGSIGPGKGIENVIQQLRRALQNHPDVASSHPGGYPSAPSCQGRGALPVESRAPSRGSRSEGRIPSSTTRFLFLGRSQGIHWRNGYRPDALPRCGRRLHRERWPTSLDRAKLWFPAAILACPRIARRRTPRSSSPSGHSRGDH